MNTPVALCSSRSQTPLTSVQRAAPFGRVSDVCENRAAVGRLVSWRDVAQKPDQRLTDDDWSALSRGNL